MPNTRVMRRWLRRAYYGRYEKTQRNHDESDDRGVHEDVRIGEHRGLDPKHLLERPIPRRQPVKRGSFPSNLREGVMSVVREMAAIAKACVDKPNTLSDWVEELQRYVY